MYACIAVAVVVVEGIAIGVIFDGYRGMVMGVAHGLSRLRLGWSLVQLVFDRIVKITDAEKMGERGGRLVRTAERMPLA